MADPLSATAGRARGDPLGCGIILRASAVAFLPVADPDGLRVAYPLHPAGGNGYATLS